MGLGAGSPQGMFDNYGQMWLDIAMTRSVKIAELKDQLSKHLRAVERGAEVEVTDRDRPIARIVPVGAGDEVIVHEPRRPFSSFRRRRFRPAGWAVTSTEMLLEERQRR